RCAAGERGMLDARVVLHTAGACSRHRAARRHPHRTRPVPSSRTSRRPSAAAGRRPVPAEQQQSPGAGPGQERGTSVNAFDPAVAPLEWTDLDDRAVKTIKALAADAVEKVGNGHPGTAISLAPAAYLLFQKVMRHDPSDDQWVGRDRFVLSAGHSSLTIYLQLFLAGYGLEMEDIAALRTWGSKTPGHPEYKHTRGVEITTGPLGQGLASAVGMAFAARRERGLLDPSTAPGE